MDTTTTETGQAVPVDTTGGTTGDNIVKDVPTTSPFPPPPAPPILEHKEDQPTPYQAITEVKGRGDALIAHIKKHGSSNELSKAVAKIEEGIMWAIKHLGNML